MISPDTHFYPHMHSALQEAEQAFSRNEVPIGAVLVSNGTIIGRGHNLTETSKDPSAHAEILALRQAAANLQNWRMPEDAEMYVTVEPCTMCVGAMLQARIRKVIFGAREPSTGALGSYYDLSLNQQGQPRISVVEGILEEECRLLMQKFFHLKRKEA